MPEKIIKVSIPALTLSIQRSVMKEGYSASQSDVVKRGKVYDVRARCLRGLRVVVKVGSGSARDPQHLRSLSRHSGMPSIPPSSNSVVSTL